MPEIYGGKYLQSQIYELIEASKTYFRKKNRVSFTSEINITKLNWLNNEGIWESCPTTWQPWGITLA